MVESRQPLMVVSRQPLMVVSRQPLMVESRQPLMVVSRQPLMVESRQPLMVVSRQMYYEMFLWVKKYDLLMTWNYYSRCCCLFHLSKIEKNKFSNNYSI